MSRFKLRTLLIVLAIGPPILAFSWREYRWWTAKRNLAAIASRLKADLELITIVPAAEWSDLTIEHTPIIQVDLEKQEPETP